MERHRTSPVSSWTYVCLMLRIYHVLSSYLQLAEGGNLRRFCTEAKDGRCADSQVFSIKRRTDFEPRPIPESQNQDYILQTSRGLQHLHSLSLVHTDIKPENLVLTQDGVVKITDFGAARVVHRQATFPPPVRSFSTCFLHSLTRPQKTSDAVFTP